MATNAANTILEQLGGRKFQAMTGATKFIADTESLMFSLPRQLGNHGINKVIISLDPGDAYFVAFYNIRGTKVKLISEHTGIYADDLQGLFTRETGLDTHL